MGYQIVGEGRERGGRGGGRSCGDWQPARFPYCTGVIVVTGMGVDQRIVFWSKVV